MADNSNLFGQLTQTATPSGSSLMSTMGPQFQQMYGQLNNGGNSGGYRGWSGATPSFTQYAPVNNPIPQTPPPSIQPTGNPSPVTNPQAPFSSIGQLQTAFPGGTPTGSTGGTTQQNLAAFLQSLGINSGNLNLSALPPAALAGQRGFNDPANVAAFLRQHPQMAASVMNGQGGGGQNGIGAAGQAGGQPGSAGTGFAKDAADALTGLATGGIGLLGAGTLGAMASRGMLGPSFGNISLEAMARDPGAYGTGPTGNGLGTGTNQGGSGTTIGNENAGAKAAATGTNNQGGYSPGVDTGGAADSGGGQGSGPGGIGGAGSGSGGIGGVGGGSGDFGGVMAKGGIVRGKGGPRQDNIPAHLSVGEGVVNNPATKAVGSRFINNLNRIGNAPGSAGSKRKRAKRLVKGLQ